MPEIKQFRKKNSKVTFDIFSELLKMRSDTYVLHVFTEYAGVRMGILNSGSPGSHSMTFLS